MKKVILIFVTIVLSGLLYAKDNKSTDALLREIDGIIKNRQTYGAEKEARIADPNLGKVMLYQLSYFRIFSFAVAKVGIFRKPANILHTFFTEICSLCIDRKTIILIINSFGHDNLHKKIACIFQLSPLWSR